MSKSIEDEGGAPTFDQLSARNFELERVNRIVGHYKALVEGSDDVIMSTDLNGIVQTANPAVAKLTGYGPQEIIGKPVVFWLRPENQKEELALLKSIPTGQPAKPYETVLMRKDGKPLHVWCCFSPIADTLGQIIGVSKIVRDITHRVERETELRRAQEDLKKTMGELEKANENLETANRAMDNFFAILSHELRTPLNPIMLLASDNVTNPSLPSQISRLFVEAFKRRRH